MKKTLVTGGCGFVGRHLIARLLQEGHEIHCVDPIVPLSGGIRPEEWPLFQPLEHGGFHFYPQDCRDWFGGHEDTDFDYAFHLAAMVGGREMIENNPLAVADDLSIDAQYWQWAVKTRPVKNIVFSSSAAYPIELQRPDHYELLREEMITFEDRIGMPDMTYGWAKLTNEYLARLAVEKHALKAVCYRPFSGYGEDQDDSYPFPGVCKRVLANRGAEEITVWGSGRQMRDFIHIDDCVEGILTTMDQIDDASALNLSTGLYTSFIEFARIAAELCGFSPAVKGTSNKPEGVFARGGDTARQRELGFTHTLSFRDGIARALNYYDA
ncbi:NAD-dependent epimerase/dehydratase family protein [Tichowtungia aerotolerans]|uniref:NAD-dependent epimerase/dehydratase family protein n=1 Tax=Tichowtungia aerotolerans TaxID=2697043 RepID=A0A6P1MAS3_9BACT|nr:NAD-dependent epimerase/dehydratase family protein [Tichowtungia aerotolerans]QHI70203.1 NAD-dependent epimerase/dehydratase family protein [Tichowtungia aerotolerans]